MNPSREAALFQVALSKPAAKRAAWLDAECDGDTAMRQRLEALLAAHEQPETLLATQADSARPTIKLDLADAPDEAVGQTLGRYKLLERVGEGGCGVVYVAEQTEPVRRRVALKVIKLGMDTKQVVARFEAERQALAMMDHPNIARVLDAGTTDVGRPFFMMELVRGISRSRRAGKSTFLLATGAKAAHHHARPRRRPKRWTETIMKPNDHTTFDVSRFSAFVACLVFAATTFAAEPPTMRLEVDAREISRKLLHTRQEIPVRPGKVALWYPKWIPGTHSPGGPVQNLGGLRVETRDGKPIAWRRDEAEPYRIELTAPAGSDDVVVRLDYICNQPTVNSDGVDSFGNAHLGVINWNTCVLYPEGVSIDDLHVSAKLLLPAKWRFGTALTVAKEGEGEVEFKSETLRDFVDCPIIFGEHFRTIELKPKNFPPTFLHLASESPGALQLEDKVIAQYANVASEAGAMFGGVHFTNYHFLVTCSDEIGLTGLEHLSSSLNGVRERDLIDDKKRKGWVAMLLPHEFAHSWCGKHRRPAGMVTKDFHAPERTSLLWVYEGLTEYLGGVLEVRSGLTTTNEYREGLAYIVSDLLHTEGRRWRPLEDTAIANHVLRAGSPSWGALRRSQDYYYEGQLLWLEADAIIRQSSDGRRSLDDFCKKFMGPGRTEKIAPYDRADVVRTLNEVVAFDWEKFIHDRVDVPQEALPLSVVERCGYRLQYANKPSEQLELYENFEDNRKFTYVADSIGLVCDQEGKILNVIPGMAGDKAGLAPGMKVEGVNGRKFSGQRVKDAIADSVAKRQIEFLVLQGDTFRTFTLQYAEGPKYLELVRDPDKPDILMSILKPAVAEAK